MRPLRASAALLALALLAAAPDVFARRVPPPPPPAPVTLQMSGAKSIRARLSLGVGMPCDSSADVKIYDGPVDPGFSQTWMAASWCFCVEHTTESFPDTEWVDARIVCRPQGNPPITLGVPD